MFTSYNRIKEPQGPTRTGRNVTHTFTKTFIWQILTEHQLCTYHGSVCSRKQDRKSLYSHRYYILLRQTKIIKYLKKVNKVTSDGDKGCKENKTRVMWLRLSGSLWQVIREDFSEPAMWKSGRKVFQTDPDYKGAEWETLCCFEGKKKRYVVMYTKLYFQMPQQKIKSINIF